MQRYVGETERLYGILDARLSGRKYLVGDKFTIADMSILGWANFASIAGIDLGRQFPNVKAWLDRVLDRPAVQKGLAVPQESPMTNAALAKKLAEGGEEVRQQEEAAQCADITFRASAAPLSGSDCETSPGARSGQGPRPPCPWCPSSPCRSSS